MTCALFTAITCNSFNKGRKNGPYLVVDKSTDKVSLPHEGIEFDVDDVVHIQYITTKQFDWGGIRSIFNVKAFDFIKEPLLESTDVPVVRIVDDQIGRTTTETTLRGNRLANHNAADRPAKVDRN